MRFFVALFLCVIPILAANAEIPGTSSDYIVAGAASGNELKLANGSLVRLENIEEPFPDGKWRDMAREFLGQFTKDKTITIENQSIDRYGRLTGQAYVTTENKQKTWLQGEMLKQGLAFVYPGADADEQIGKLREIENAARKEKTGIWGDLAYADTASDNLNGRVGHFAFVSGVVLDAEKAKNIVYLNFGEDWRTDFTATIAAHNLRAFRDAGVDPLAYKGKRIRVRGWVKREYGPVIDVTDPAQIDILDLR